MPRRCLCDRLRQRIATDARLATLPMAAKWLWLSLAERAAETPDGVLHLGSAFGFLTGIAMLIQAAEPEVETHWQTLETRGLALREGDSVRIPDLPLLGARAAQARTNGGLGGRPRRGETPEQARLRRSQGHLMLPVEGGSGEAVAKPTGTEAGNPAVSGTTITEVRESVVSESRGKPGAGVSHSALGAEIATLAGLDPVRQRFDYRPVQEWLAAGMSPALIRATVAEIVARPGFEPSRIHSLRYFTPSLEQALAERRAELAPPRPMAPLTAQILAWHAAGADPRCAPTLPAVAA